MEITKKSIVNINCWRPPIAKVVNDHQISSLENEYLMNRHPVNIIKAVSIVELLYTTYSALHTKRFLILSLGYAI